MTVLRVRDEVATVSTWLAGPAQSDAGAAGAQAMLAGLLALDAAPRVHLCVSTVGQVALSCLRRRLVRRPDLRDYFDASLLLSEIHSRRMRGADATDLRAVALSPTVVVAPLLTKNTLVTTHRLWLDRNDHRVLEGAAAEVVVCPERHR